MAESAETADADALRVAVSSRSRRWVQPMPVQSTVKDLKMQLAKEWSIPIVCQSLFMGQLRLSDSDLLKELSAGELLEVQLNPSFELEGSVDSEDERTFEAAAPSAEPTLQAALTPSKLLSTAAKAAKAGSFFLAKVLRGAYL
ncbi:unnamed protein product [Effrenium voratum]|nr:unnamed protein product [Effrenium voratum]